MSEPLIEPVAAAYVHIPFCVRKCAYCDFASYAGCLDRLPAYIDALVQEIRVMTVHAEGQPLSSVFFGGGTPSLMTAGQVDRILSALAAACGLAADAEISLEANPGTVRQEQLLGYRRAGCNRISIGVQAMQPRILRLLGRIHQPEEALDAIRQADAAGLTRISADLMFGLPEQSVSDVAASVRALLEAPVTHLSFYSLSLEPGTEFYQRYEHHPDKLPDEEMERDQYEVIRSLTAKAGMKHYEISNAALPGEQCRHNLTYWQAKPYYGFGAGAHSYVGAVRRGNVTGIDDYIRRVSAQDQPFAAAESAEPLNRSQQEQEFMLLGLRLLDGVDADTFHQRFGGNLFTRFGQEITDLADRGLIEQDGRIVRLTRKGLDLANQVFMAFV